MPPLAPKAEIRWTMASSTGTTFVISIEDFLLCAVMATAEADFRAAIYKAGHVEHADRHKVAGAGA